MTVYLGPQDHQTNQFSNAADLLHNSLRIQPLQVRFDLTEQRYFPHPYDWHDASRPLKYFAA
jgi:hypothetical protein